MKVLDELGNEYSVFGVGARKTIKEVSNIYIDFIVVPYSLDGSSVKTTGTIGMEGPKPGKIEISVQENSAGITFYKVPSLINLVFVVPNNTNIVRLNNFFDSFIELK